MFFPDGDDIVNQQVLWNGCRKLSVRRKQSGETALVFFFPVVSSHAGDLEKLYQYFLLLKNIASPHVVAVREVQKIFNPPLHKNKVLFYRIYHS